MGVLAFVVVVVVVVVSDAGVLVEVLALVDEQTDNVGSGPSGQKHRKLRKKTPSVLKE